MTHHRRMLLALAVSASLLCYSTLVRADATGAGTATGTETGTATGAGTATDAGTATGTSTGTATGVGTGRGTATDAGPWTAGEELTPEERALAEALQKVAQVTLDTLDQVNPVASNSGLGNLFEGVAAYRTRLENLAKGLDEAGHPMSRRALKQAIGASGSNKIKQVLDAQKEALERATRISQLPELASNLDKLGKLFDAVEVGSKTVGAIAEGDMEGALIQALNGGCKILVTNAAGAAGAAIGAPLSPGGSIVLGAAAAGLADIAYDASVGELFKALDQFVLNVEQIQKVNTERFMNQYGDLASSDGVTFADKYAEYKLGLISEKDFRSFNRVIRPKIQKRAAEIAEKNRAFVMNGLRNLGELSTSMAGEIDKYAAGTLDLRGQMVLLKAVLASKSSTCKQDLPRDIMRDRLAGIGYGKFMRVMKASQLKAPVNLLSCFCSSYSIAGNGIRYLPEPREGCPANEGPCKGGNFGCVSYGLPGSPQVWASCVSGNPLEGAEVESGPPIPATRLDQYLVDKSAMREGVKR